MTITFGNSNSYNNLNKGLNLKSGNMNKLKKKLIRKPTGR